MRRLTLILVWSLVIGHWSFSSAQRALGPVTVTTLNGTTPSVFGLSLLDDANAAAARTTLGLSANGQSLITAADYAAMRTLLGLDDIYQPLHEELTRWAEVARGAGFDTFAASYPSGSGFTGLTSTAVIDEPAAVFGTSFSGSAVQPVIYINVPTGFVGDFARWRLNAVDKFSVDQTGKITSAAGTISLGGNLITAPAATTLPVVSQRLNITGPTATRTITIPDADFTVARKDGDNNFSTNQTFTDTAEGIALHGGGTITGASGAITITALSGQNLNLTTNGVGAVTVGGIMNVTTQFNSNNFRFGSGGLYSFSSAPINLSSGSPLNWNDDFRISRSAAGIGQLGTTANNALGSLLLTNLTASGDLALGKTITAGGTTGAQTINKSSGSVNFAAGATSLVVTNSLPTANSVIHVTVATNDTTMKSAHYAPASGSFTIYPDAAPTAETRVNFLVTN